MKCITVEQAKEVLRNEGYFIDNLWHVNDVYQECNCIEKKVQAQEILNKALTNEVTMEQIWFSIEECKND